MPNPCPLLHPFLGHERGVAENGYCVGNGSFRLLSHSTRAFITMRMNYASDYVINEVTQTKIQFSRTSFPFTIAVRHFLSERYQIAMRLSTEIQDVDMICHYAMVMKGMLSPSEIVMQSTTNTLSSCSKLKCISLALPGSRIVVLRLLLSKTQSNKSHGHYCHCLFMSTPVLTCRIIRLLMAGFETVLLTACICSK